ncbi:hypothetical protein G7077_00495 [Sphingomonas piscis]|uniref:Secreted protein n=1 Tax=Sphingomonas piscis TaxID=2714943 RepID=A0A6G7YLK5_9SPHN|nr:hypothetical protein [Sphingomonas piscis]QIK77622.1 hypothetical protein G7077_00495 [Sphingomonas piscis]
MRSDLVTVHIEGKNMRLLLLAAAAAVSLSACGGNGDDKLGDQAEDRAEAQADNLEAMADNSSGAMAENLEDQADAVERNGEKTEERIDDSDVDASSLSDAQRNALVNGQ